MASVVVTPSVDVDGVDVEVLEGRRVLVTGASSGIGAATARAVADAGGRVALLARRGEVLRELAAELDGVVVPADVTDLSAVTTAVDEAAEQLGGLDGVVAAAGLARPATLADADPADWRAMLDVNVLGLLHTLRATLPHLVAAGNADAVLVSSMSGRRLQSAELGVYAATKAAVHTIAEGARKELGGRGVRVTTLAPGLVETAIFEGQDDPVATRLRDAAGVVGLTPQDVADRTVEILAAPPHVLHVEVALLHRDQP